MPSPSRWRQLLREPLLYFVIGGAAVFFVYQRIAPPDASAVHLQITPELIDALRADHQRRTGATPTRDEERSLIERHVDNELLYQTARDLGLDQGDVIVRRRLIQKMEFILENSQALSEPSEGELQAYLASHAARYMLPSRLTLTHVFVSSDHHDAARKAQTLRQELLDGASPDALGDAFLHGRHLASRSPAELAVLFGPQFTAAVEKLPTDAWSQPIASSYGLHLVRIDSRTPAALPPLSDASRRLREDWQQEQREAAREHGLARLRKQYGVQLLDPAQPSAADSRTGDTGNP